MHRTQFGLRLYNPLYQRTLKTLRYVHTVRTGFGMLVRNFFDILATGALMVYGSCTGYLELGFVGGVHYHSDEPCDLPEFLQELHTSGLEHDIAATEHHITVCNHFLHFRARQIALDLDALTRSTYCSDLWGHSPFFIEEH